MKWSGECPLVLRPSTTEQVSKILAYCNTRRIAVVPQGGNTGLVGGSIPVHDEIVLNMSRMNAILALDTIQGIVTVEAGCILEALNVFLEERGFIVPVDLGAKGSCHIGGNAATAAGGLRFVRYGSLRGTILGLEAVLADGTVVDVLTNLRKDNTGLDIKQLFIGSEGTLGVITKLSLLCPPKPSAVTVAYLGLPSYAAVMQAMALARKHCMETISATEFQDRESLELVLKHLPGTRDPLPTLKAPFYLLVEVSGGNATHNREKLDTFLESAYDTIEGVDGTVADSVEQVLGLWRLREGIAEGASKEGYVFKYDVSLPVSQMYDLVDKVKERVAPLGASVVGYGHLGDGNLHINIMLPRKEGGDELRKRIEQGYKLIEPWIFEQLKEVRGSISAEHGLGQAKNEFIEYSKARPAVVLMQKIKDMMDPNGIMNPYKFLPTRKEVK